jgi:TniQ protein
MWPSLRGTKPLTRASSRGPSLTALPNVALRQPDRVSPSSTRRRGLRDIVGGYSIDRWPIKVNVADDETLVSWFRRVSDRYQLTPRQLCEAMEVKLGNNAKIADVLNQHRDAVEYALDVRLGDFAPAHAGYLRSPWLGSFVDSAHRFCPICLEENGYWEVSWEGPLSVVCPRHRILYVDRCPACGEQPWRTGAWLGQCAATRICTARVPAKAGPKRKVGQWCGADLCEATRIPAPDAVVQAQAFLTDHEHWASDGSAPKSLRRFGIDTAESREVLAALVGAAWTQTRREPATAARRANALHMGIVAYQQLAAADGPTPHLDQLGAVMNLDQILLGGSDSVGLYGPVIAAWYIDRVRDHLTPRKQLGWRTGRQWPSLPADPTTPRATTHTRLPEHRQQLPCLPAAWVPQLLPAPGLDFPWEPDPAGRALATMCLLNLGRGIQWSYIALELGLPARLQHLLAARLVNTPKPVWRRFLSSLEDAVHDMCRSPPHINYRHRRIVAADAQLLRQSLAAQTSLEPRNVPQDWLTALWAAYTGGDIGFAPPAIGSAPPEGAVSQAESSRAAAGVTTGPLYARICQDLDATVPAHNPHDMQPP